MRGMLSVFIFLCALQCASSHVTMRPFPGECVTSVPIPGGTSSTACSAGASTYMMFRVPHAIPGNYTYQLSILTPNVGPTSALTSVKPAPIPGWKLSYDLLSNPSTRWINYTAYPGNEVYDGWALQFNVLVSVNCAASGQLTIDDTLIVPMGTYAGVPYYGALFPAIQFFCEMQSDGMCHPNGRFATWTGYAMTSSYDDAGCGKTAATTGTCNQNCKGASTTSPCFAFQLAQASTCKGITNFSFASSGAPWTVPSPPFPPALTTRSYDGPLGTNIGVSPSKSTAAASWPNRGVAAAGWLLGATMVFAL